MNTVVKKEWVEALRSGKYKQMKGALREEVEGETRFCAMGVLCDISKLGEWHKHEFESRMHSYTYGIPNHSCTLNMVPIPVYEWAGMMKQLMPKVNEKRLSIIALNDSEGMTFGQIAKIIEEQL